MESILQELKHRDIVEVLELFESLPVQLQDLLFSSSDIQVEKLDKEDDQPALQNEVDLKVVSNEITVIYHGKIQEAETTRSFWNTALTRLREERDVCSKTFTEIKERVQNEASRVWNTTHKFIPTMETFLISKISRFVHNMRTELSQKAIAASGLPISNKEFVWALLTPKKIRELIEMHENTLQSYIPYFMGVCYRELATRLKLLIEQANELARKDRLYNAWKACSAAVKLAESHSDLDCLSTYGLSFRSSCGEEIQELRLLSERITKSESTCLSASNSLLFSPFVLDGQVGKPIYFYLSAKNKLGAKLKNEVDISRFCVQVNQKITCSLSLNLHYLGNSIYAAVFFPLEGGTYEVSVRGTEGFSEEKWHCKGSPLSFSVLDKACWTVTPVHKVCTFCWHENIINSNENFTLLGIGRDIFMCIADEQKELQFFKFSKNESFCWDLKKMDPFGNQSMTTSASALPTLIRWKEGNVLSVMNGMISDPEGNELTNQCIKCYMMILTAQPYQAQILWTKFYRLPALAQSAACNLQENTNLKASQKGSKSNMITFSQYLVLQAIEGISISGLEDIVLPIRYVDTAGSWQVNGTTLPGNDKFYIFGSEVEQTILISGTTIAPGHKLPMSDDLTEGSSFHLSVQPCCGNIPCTRSGAVILLEDKYVVVYGGIDEFGRNLDDLFIMNVENHLWRCIYYDLFCFDSEIELQSTFFTISGESVLSYALCNTFVKEFPFTANFEVFKCSKILKELIDDVKMFCDENRAALRTKLGYASKVAVYRALNRAQIDHKVELAIEMYEVLSALSPVDTKELKAELVAVRNSVIQLNNLAMDIKAKILVSNPTIENIMIRNIEARLKVIEIDAGQYVTFETGLIRAKSSIDSERNLIMRLERELILEETMESFFGNDKSSDPTKSLLIVVRNKLSGFQKVWDIIETFENICSCELHKAMLIDLNQVDLMVRSLQDHRDEDNKGYFALLLPAAIEYVQNGKHAVERIVDMATTKVDNLQARWFIL